MATKTKKQSVDIRKWDQVTQFQEELTPTAAPALLKVKISSDVEDRMRSLLKKAKAGSLSELEKSDMDGYEQMACMLDILHSKARRVLSARHAS